MAICLLLPLMELYIASYVIRINNVGLIRHGRGASTIIGEATICALAVHRQLLHILLYTSSQRASPSL